MRRCERGFSFPEVNGQRECGDGVRRSTLQRLHQVGSGPRPNQAWGFCHGLRRAFCVFQRAATQPRSGLPNRGRIGLCVNRWIDVACKVVLKDPTKLVGKKGVVTEIVVDPGWPEINNWHLIPLRMDKSLCFDLRGTIWQVRFEGQFSLISSPGRAPRCTSIELTKTNCSTSRDCCFRSSLSVPRTVICSYLGSGWPVRSK
jgi:hypothetical protein